MPDNDFVLRCLEQRLEQRLQRMLLKDAVRKDAWYGLSPSRTAGSLVVAVVIHQSLVLL